jgi:Spy/CpxP family protein refolding chaperone
MKHSTRLLAIAALLGLAACSQTGADTGVPFGPGSGRGPGSGYGPGYGMMGPGYGMMGPGYGMTGPGYGMMGPGYGMMGGWAGLPADLTEEQRRQIGEIQRAQRARQWPLMQQMHELMWAEGDALDEPAQRRGYESIAALQKQMFENMLDARRRIDAVLTPQQREEVRRGWRGPR